MQIPYAGRDSSKFLQIKDDKEPLALRSSFHARAFNNILYIPEEFSFVRNYYLYFLGLDKLINIKRSYEISYINDPVLYLYYPHNQNYSHFTLQVLSGYLAAKKLGILGGGIKIAIDQTIQFQKELAKIFGIDNESIISLKTDIIYSFYRVYYYTSLFSGEIDTQTIELFEKYVPDFGFNNNKKLYITRAASIRNIVNNNEVNELLHKRDFEIIDFAHIPVYKQIGYMQSSSFICALHGASGANLVYKNKEKFRFIELFSSSWQNACHALILNAKNCDYTPVLCQAVNSDNTSHINVDLNNLNQALDEIVHTFEYSPVDTLAQSMTAEHFIKQYSGLKEQIDKIPQAQNFTSFILAGDYKSIINKLKLYPLKRMDPGLLRLFYFSAFFTFSKDAFFELTKSIINININSIIDLILDFNYKIGNFDMVKQAKSLINFIKPDFIRSDLMSLADNDLPTPDLGAGKRIMTWHNVYLGVDFIHNRLIQQEKQDKSIELRGNPGAYGLYIPSEQKYIQEIKKDLTLLLGEEPNHSILKTHNQWNFSIISANSYLSASNNKKSFKHEHIPREWERYFISF